MYVLLCNIVLNDTCNIIMVTCSNGDIIGIYMYVLLCNIVLNDTCNIIMVTCMKYVCQSYCACDVAVTCYIKSNPTMKHAVNITGYLYTLFNK